MNEWMIKQGSDIWQRQKIPYLLKTHNHLEVGLCSTQDAIFPTDQAYTDRLPDTLWNCCDIDHSINQLQMNASVVPHMNIFCQL